MKYQAHENVRDWEKGEFTRRFLGHVIAENDGKARLLATRKFNVWDWRDIVLTPVGQRVKTRGLLSARCRIELARAEEAGQ